MKKLIALMLAMVMALSLVACGKPAENDDSANDNNTNTDGDATATRTFVMGVDAEYPPLQLSGRGRPVHRLRRGGLQGCLRSAGLGSAGLRCELGPEAGAAGCQGCDCVWSGMTILDSMKEAGYVISAPYYDNTQVIMVKEGSDIKSSADLAGKVVAVQLGTSGEALLADGGDLADLAATFADLTTCDSFLKCFTELGGGAVDAVIVDKPVAVSYAESNKGFTVLDEGLGAEQYGIAFRAGDEELCATVEDAVAQLVANGTYAEIAAKYPDIANNLTLLG